MDVRLGGGGERGVQLTDGRFLGYLEAGDPQGYPLLFCHGMPGSRVQGQFFDQAARQWGFRIIAPDRAGIGLSDGRGQRCLLADARDLIELAERLKLDRFGVFGWSSGGPVALATAYLAPRQISFVASIAGYTHLVEYPQGRRELLKKGWPLPYLDRGSRRLFRWLIKLLLIWARWLPRMYYRQLLRATGDDRKLLQQGDLARLFFRDQLEVIHSHSRAVADDLSAQHADWGFRLGEIRVPVWILQGERDRFVPVSMARHLAGTIPEAELYLFPQYGHLFPLDQGFQRVFLRRARDWIFREPPAAGSPRQPGG